MKVITVGGAMVDSIAIIDAEHIERMTMRNIDSSFLLLEEGRKTEAEEISNHCGGGAVNAAVSIARMGAEVATLIKLGKDQRAETILHHLQAEGISAKWVQYDPKAATGASVLISSHDKNAAIFTFRGANSFLKKKDLCDDMFNADLVYIAGLSNGSAQCFPDIARRAQNAGAFVAANPGIRQLTNLSQPFQNTLKNIDILSVNRVEADAMVPALFQRTGARGPSFRAELIEAAPELFGRGFRKDGYAMTMAGYFAALSEAGPKYIIITDSGEGAYLGTKDHIYHCPIIPAEIAGTAGAGDAFASTLSLFLAEEKNVTKTNCENALLAASVNAASVITHADTQTGLLNRAQIKKRMKAASQTVKLQSWNIANSII